MDCRRFQDLADSYLAEELLVETNHDVIRHLESCPACRGELAARRQLRATLQAAFAQADELRPAAGFEARVRARLAREQQEPRHEPAEPRHPRRWLAGIHAARTNTPGARAAHASSDESRPPTPLGPPSPREGGRGCVVDSIRGRTRPDAASNGVAWAGASAADASTSDAPRGRWSGIGRRWAIAAALVIAGALTLNSVGGGRSGPAQAPVAGRALQEAAADAAGDHEECAVNNRQADRLALNEASRRYDPAYAGLVDVLQQTLPSGRDGAPHLTPISVVEGHSCVFQGRRFGHVTMTRGGRLASVLVTNVQHPPHGGLPRPGSLNNPRDGARRVNVCAARAGFRVACFRAPRHAVFVVSDLGEQDNLALARAMAPALQRHLAQPKADSGPRLGGLGVPARALAALIAQHPGPAGLWTFSSRHPAIVLDDAAFFDAQSGVVPASD